MQHPPVHPMADIPTVTRSHHPALNFALIKKSIPLFPNVVHPTIQEFERISTPDLSSSQR
jgi:hypothetical protein